MYSHSYIVLNQHEVKVSSILGGAYTPQTEFETTTIAFIRQWLNSQSEFTLQTSGSTGVPKKIIVSRDQMIASAKATLQALQLKPDNIALVCLPTQYIAGIMMLTRALVGNLQIIAVEPSANPFINFRSKVSIDFAALVPYQAEAIIESNGLNGIDSVKNIIIGGAPVSLSLQQKLKKSPSAIYQTYGMTETLSHVALQKISGDDSQNYFTTLPNIIISVDGRGCLVIRTNYLKEPVITNDLVELISTTGFRWLGRWDNVINTGGVKVHPEQVEKVIALVFAEQNITNDFFVYGIPDEKLGHKLILFIEGTLAIEKQILWQQLQKELSMYEVPRQMFCVEKFIKTETGKVKRKETVTAVKID